MSTQVERDEEVRREQEQDSAPSELHINSELGRVTLFAPLVVAQAAHKILDRYEELTHEFNRRFMDVSMLWEFLDKLSEGAKSNLSLSLIELRHIPTASRRFKGIVQFRMIFQIEPHGRWVLEIPPVTSGSLIQESDHAAQLRTSAGEPAPSEGSLVSFRRR